MTQASDRNAPIADDSRYEASRIGAIDEIRQSGAVLLCGCQRARKASECKGLRGFFCNSPVTDSGAAATALAAGIKTTNAALSVTPSGEPVETVLELAERSGMMTGLVTTTGFWDATPAAFASHTMSRRDAESIVQQMLSSGIDLIISNGSDGIRVVTRDRPCHSSHSARERRCSPVGSTTPTSARL